MLKVLRENVKQLHWILWLVIAAFVGFVFVDFGGANLSGTAPSDAVASVEGRDISWADYERAYRGLENQARSTYGDAYTAELATQLRLPQRALSDLVTEKILLLEADRLGLEATAGEVREAILQVPAFLNERGQFVGESEYQQILRANRLAVGQFEQSMRQQVLRSKLTAVLADTIYVSDSDVERHAREEAEKATLRYVRLAAAALAGEVAIESGEVEAHFAERREAYRLPEKRAVGYLSVNINTVRAGLEIPEQELREYYEANLEEFTQEEQVRARHILLFASDQRSPEQARAELDAVRRRLEAGEDFATIAQAVSEDEGTKTRGGDLGYFGRGRMTPAFEEAAFAGEPGSVVGPVENRLGNRTGFHLIEVLDRRQGGTQGFDEVSNRIRVRLLNDRSLEAAEEKTNDLYARLEEETPGDDETLRRLAEQEGIAYEQTTLFAEDEAVPGIGRGTPFTRAAFSLAPDRYSEPVRIPAGWAILALREVQEPRLPELAEVEEQVRQDLLSSKQNELATARMESLRAQLAAGERNLDEVAGELGGEVRDGGTVTRNGSVSGIGRHPEIVAKALELEAGEFGGPFVTDQGIVLFEVTERQRFDRESFAAEKETNREQLELERLNTLFVALIEQRRAELDISYNPQFVEQFELGGDLAVTL